MLGPRRRLDANLDARFFHRKRSEFRLDSLAQLPRRFLSRSSQLRGRGFIRLGESSRLFPQRLAALARMADLLQIPPDLLQKCDHFTGRRAVFSLQLFESGQARLNLIETRRISLQLRQIAPQRSE